MAAIGSFIAGTFSVAGLMLLAPPLARMALRFGPPEYFFIMILGLTLVTRLGGSPLKSLIMGTLGFITALIGSDPLSGAVRFTYGSIYLLDGIYVIPVVMGLFAISEVMENLDTMGQKVEHFSFKKMRGLLPTRKDWRDSWWAILRGTVVGFFLGILPGSGAVISTFASYAIEKKMSKHPQDFGHGAIAGVAGPESANNAGAEGAMIPLFALGIPGNAVTAILAAALMVHGLQFGPLLFRTKPILVWGILASMYVGNVMLLILNLPLIKIWVKVLEIPRSLLFPLILVFTYVGTIAAKANVFDLWLLLIFGLLGYFAKLYKYPCAPFVLAFILGPMIEKNLIRSIAMGEGSIGIFLERPITLFFLGVILLTMVYPAVSWIFQATKRSP